MKLKAIGSIRVSCRFDLIKELHGRYGHCTCYNEQMIHFDVMTIR